MLPADSPFASLPAPGPHPATAELRAYAAGTLSAADEHRIEAHALDCERCAELLEGFSMSDAVTTDQTLAELRTRLQARVADNLVEPVPLPIARPLWPPLAAAMALLGAVGAGLWGWQRQLPTAEVAISASRETVALAIAPAPPAPVARTSPQPVASAPDATAPLAVPPVTRSSPSYAAGRANTSARDRYSLHRPAPATPPLLADQSSSGSADADEWAQQAAPATSAAKKSADREIAAAPVAEPAAIAAAEEAPASGAIATAAPARIAAAKPVARADSNAAGKDVTFSRFKKAKATESAALVRDKPMPAAMAIAPAPVAGTPALHDYLRHEAAKFEPEEGAKSLHGAVRLRFVVGADGKLSKLQVLYGLRADYDEEALRLVCEGPAWRPGITDGRRTALPVEVTVSF